MGEVAEQVGRFVNAYSGDLRDETLDGQRVVVGGIVTGAADGDHQAPGDDGDRDAGGPPGFDRGRRLPAAVRDDPAALRDGAILLVAGRVDHKGEEVSLLADLVADWDDAASRGPEAFAREVAAGDRSGRNGSFRRTPVAVGAGPSGRPGASVGRPAVRPAAAVRPPARSCRRDATTVAAARPRPYRTSLRPTRSRHTSSRRPGAPRRSDGEHVPRSRRCPTRRARASSVTPRRCPASPPGRRGPPRPLRAERPAPDRLVRAMETVKLLLRDRPGGTRVVLHVPASERWSGTADGAALGRRLRRRAAGGGPAAARATASSRCGWRAPSRWGAPRVSARDRYR